MARNTFDADETLEQGFNKHHMKRLLDYATPYKKPIIETMILMIVASCSGLLAPLLIKIALDDVIPSHNIKGLVLVAIVFIISIGITSLIMRRRMKVMGQVGQDMLVDMRHDLFENLQRLPFAYYDSRPHGKILVRIVNYINSLSDLLSNGIINLAADIVTVLLTIVFMFVLDTRLALVSLIGIPLLMVIMYPLKNAQRKAFQKLSTKQSNMNAYVHESIQGMVVTQAFVHEEQSRSVNKQVSEEYSESWLKAVKTTFLVWPAIDMVSNITIAMVYITAIFVFKTNISLGVLVAFIGYLWRFWGPITNIGNFYNSIVNAMAYLERIFELMDEKPTVTDSEDAIELPTIKGHIVFEDIHFSYDEDNPILKGIDLEVKVGERIAVVGSTGSGKTTLINLISRFYNIDKGHIYIDGYDISKVTIQSLRRQMGIMMQDSFIFSGTIMENIRYGKLDATDEEIIEAAKLVRAHEFITSLEDGYHTVVNERGDRLSVGQRQLISFARTILSDPTILILDEATSSIDSQTEVLLQQGLERLLKGRTSFVIAHRLSTIKNADKIIYIDDGKITEMGSHDELIAVGGAYFSLYTTQLELLKA
ncbi:MAG TPA: ABC transporter ATP-binding protein [Epulopiscium sp.]|nr:ABC transporter ATP-binding protein [Candidatus Epulonipiscium sp.]